MEVAENRPHDPVDFLVDFYNNLLTINDIKKYIKILFIYFRLNFYMKKASTFEIHKNKIYYILNIIILFLMWNIF